MSDETRPQLKKHVARLLAVQYFFTQLKSEKEAKEYFFFEPNTLLSELDTSDYDKELYEKLIDGIERYGKSIDEHIKKLAPAWPLDEVNPVNIIILRIAIFEAFIAKITPARVAINEAIELDKSLSSISSSAFVNGVLGTIYDSSDIQTKLESLVSDDSTK